MADLKIITNGQARDLLGWHELTDAERAQFDYRTDEDGSFFRYRGATYDFGEFMRCDGNPELAGWHGYHGDSFFSGVLVRLCSNGERVKVGRYYS